MCACVTFYLTLFYLLLTDQSSVRLDQPEVVVKGLTNQSQCVLPAVTGPSDHGCIGEYTRVYAVYQPLVFLTAYSYLMS